MESNEHGGANQMAKIEVSFQPSKSITLWSDVAGLIGLIRSCFERLGATQRTIQLKKVLESECWCELHKNSVTKRKVLSEKPQLTHHHELITATLLTQVGYDVLFAPVSMFDRNEKKFDVFLVKGSVLIKADLKLITSIIPDTIGKRIMGGSEQASRVVVHINSDIDRKSLIDGLIKGVERNNLIKEILLLYRGKFYRLPKTLILSKEIFKILK